MGILPLLHERHCLTLGQGQPVDALETRQALSLPFLARVF